MVEEEGGQMQVDAGRWRKEDPRGEEAQPNDTS